MNETTETAETAKETKEAVIPLTYKEIRALKKARYDEDILDHPKCNKAYTLKNKKTGQVVEINAASSYHACNIIGWKANKVIVIKEKILPPPPNPESSTIFR